MCSREGLDEQGSCTVDAGVLGRVLDVKLPRERCSQMSWKFSRVVWKYSLNFLPRR